MSGSAKEGTRGLEISFQTDREEPAPHALHPMSIRLAGHSVIVSGVLLRWGWQELQQSQLRLTCGSSAQSAKP